MKKSEIKQLIKESFNESRVDEMARIPGGYKLTDDFEEKFKTLPDNIQKSTRYTRIINYMKGKDSVLMKDIADSEFQTTDTASVNPQIRALLDAGVIEKTGLVSEPKKNQPKEPSGEARGRKKITNDELKSFGAKIATKYAQSSEEKPAEFTEEEKQWIMDLYKLATAKKKAAPKKAAEPKKKETPKTEKA